MSSIHLVLPPTAAKFRFLPGRSEFSPMDVHEPSGHFPALSDITGGSVSGLVATAEYELITVAEAALILKVRESWLRYKVKKGEIPCTRPGGGREIRFSRLDLAEIAAMGRQQPRRAGTAA